jgi:hypothetical protein
LTPPSQEPYFKVDFDIGNSDIAIKQKPKDNKMIRGGGEKERGGRGTHVVDEAHEGEVEAVHLRHLVRHQTLEGIQSNNIHKITLKKYQLFQKRNLLKTTPQITFERGEESTLRSWEADFWAFSSPP